MKFDFNCVERRRFDDFVAAHRGCETKDALGMKISVVFTIGGLGNAIDVCCNVCGAKENITDFDCW